jgi:hypothetical protein
MQWSRLFDCYDYVELFRPRLWNQMTRYGYVTHQQKRISINVTKMSEFLLNPQPFLGANKNCEIKHNFLLLSFEGARDFRLHNIS